MREESDPNRGGVDIIQDRMTFAAAALPQIAILRDQFIALAGELSKVQDDAKKAHEREMWAHGRPPADAPAAKRTAGASTSDGAGSSAGGSSRRVRALKAWNSAKQEAEQEKNPPPVKVTYVSVEKGEVVTVVTEEEWWLVVEKEDNSRGKVPVKISTTGEPRFEDVEEDEPAPPPPIPSSGDEQDEPEGMDEPGDQEEWAAAPDSARSTSPPASATVQVGDDDLTPGREAAPILIKQSDVGVWERQESGWWFAKMWGPEHYGATLWWAGAEHYQLGDGRLARLCMGM